jgi:DNA-binding CsgD family transcriptional regulator
MERAAEARAVADFLARAQIDPAGLVVEGEAGIGKTTLMLGAAGEAESRGFRVLSAQGSPAEVTYAYAAVADLLRDVDIDLLAALPDLQRVALERARIGEVDSGGPATDERMVANALLSVIERITAQGPVLLVIDDAQWLDASSRAVIGFAARRLTGPVGMVVSFRTGEADSADERSWLQFRQPETITRVRMRPLSLGAVHALVAARLGHTLPRPTITQIYEISGGNPLFAIELAAGAADDIAATTVELPDSLAALVRRRIGYADDDAAAVLLATACSSAPTVESVAGATDMSPARVVELLESMEHLRIITADGNRVRFTHPLFATGVYTNATPSRRRAMHRTLATVVDRPEIGARHLALAATTGDATTLSALDAAAEATIAQGAPAVAAELLELALKLGGDNAPRRIRAGELHFRAGSLVPARLHLQTALAGAPPGVLRCLALMWLGAVKAYDDDMAGAVEAMSNAVDEAGDDPALGLLCLLRLALALMMTDRLGEALRRGERAVELADRLGVPGLQSQALSIWVAGKFVSGQGVDRRALQTALELEDPYGGATTFFRASAVQAMISAYTGDLDGAWAQMRALQQRMSSGGTEVDIIWAAVHLAAIAVWSGRYAQAADAAQEATERAEQMGGRLVLVTAWTQQAAVAAYTGREADARAAARAAIDTAHQVGATQLAKEPTNSLAFLEVSLGNYPAALAALQPYLDVFDATGGTEIEGGGHLPDWIEALSALGRADEAEPLVEALERNGTRHDRPWMLAMAARGRGHMLSARGDLAGAQGAVEHAITHHQRLPMPFETARTQLLLGQLQRRRRRKQDAAVSLRAAVDTFERLGTPLWAARARAELARLESPRGDGHRLTAAEQRIAGLATTGRSNKEIAAELFIAEKTVEMNLSRVYRKLGIRSRGGLSAALNREDVKGNI